MIARTCRLVRLGNVTGNNLFNVGSHGNVLRVRFNSVALLIWRIEVRPLLIVQVIKRLVTCLRTTELSDILVK